MRLTPFPAPRKRQAVSSLLLFLALIGSLTAAAVAPAWAGSIFLTGHDPDFHAIVVGSNLVGASGVTQSA